jgi:hypothetical protein
MYVFTLTVYAGMIRSKRELGASSPPPRHHWRQGFVVLLLARHQLKELHPDVFIALHLGAASTLGLVVLGVVSGGHDADEDAEPPEQDESVHEDVQESDAQGARPPRR